MVENLADGKSSISEYDFLIYLTLRNWAKSCSNTREARRICKVEEDVWIYELDAYLISMKHLCSYLYDLSKPARKPRAALIKQNISHLICTGNIICYNKKLSVTYSANEFMTVCEEEEWEDGRYVTFYFPVHSGYFSVSGDNIAAIINYCRDQKKLGERNDHPEYYVTLYALLEYNFDISKKKGMCFLRSPRSTKFTSRRRLWEKVDDVLLAAGVIHDHKRGLDDVGNISTEQLFFNDQEVYDDYLRRTEEYKAHLQSGEGVVEKPKKELPPQEQVMVTELRLENKFSDAYKNDKFAYDLAVSFEEGRGFPKAMITADKWDVYDMVVSAYGTWKEKHQNIS